MKPILAIVAITLCTTTAHAQGSDQFSIDNALADKIYGSVTKPQTQPSEAPSTFRMQPFVSLFVPSELVLRNPYFEVDHGEQLGSLVYAGIGTSIRIVEARVVRVLGEASLGYSIRQATYSSIASTVGIAVEDAVSLEWAPITLGGRVEMSDDGVVRPAAVAGVSASWLRQAGTLDGIEQAYWVPALYAGPAVSLFGSDRGPAGSFGGIDVSGIYSAGLSDTAKLSGWALSLGARFLL